MAAYAADVVAPARRVRAVGAVAFDAERRLLVVRRAHPPALGRWSLPGGRVEPGESDADALAREVLEETGLVVTIGELVGQVERPGPGGIVYDIADHLCTVVGGTLAAGDDAADARWVSYAELARLPVTAGLVEALREWGALPR